MSVKKLITLKEWIDKVGVVEIAALLKAERSAVRHWRRGLVLPQSHQMYKIRHLSRGEVCFNKSIDEHYSDKNEKNRWKK